jgi:hypothetical protein
MNRRRQARRPRGSYSPEREPPGTSQNFQADFPR